MKHSSTIHQVTYILSIRSEYRQLGSAVFRGTLETVAGQKFGFCTLAELNGLLCDIGGWIDSPALANEGGETNASGKAINTPRHDHECYESDP